MMKNVLKSSLRFEISVFVPKTMEDRNKWLQSKQKNHLSIKSLILILPSCPGSILSSYKAPSPEHSRLSNPFSWPVDIMKINSVRLRPKNLV